MSTANGTSHLSIGEVLALLQEEFPDVTISKIRFLESQGLIEPERTASGYRKFFDDDIDQLRWILRQQRDNFLPLKVIKKMLDDGTDQLDPQTSPQPTLWTGSESDSDDDEFAGIDDGDDVEGVASGASDDFASVGAPDAERPASDASALVTPPAEATGAESSNHVSVGARSSGGGSPVAQSSHSRSSDPPARTQEQPMTTSATDPSRSRSHPAVASAGTSGRAADAPKSEAPKAQDPPARSTGHTDPSPRPRHETPADVVAALQENPGSVRGGAARSSASRATTSGRAASSSDLTAAELLEASGIDAQLLAGLEEFGLIRSWTRGGDSHYGPDAIEVARIALRYAELGIEPRHLRMHKVAAEREAGFIEQLVFPLLKQRNPAAKGQAVERAAELVEMGAALHAALLSRELGPELEQ